jgi:hypothetical protein
MPRPRTMSLLAVCAALALTACSGGDTQVSAGGGATSPVTLGVVTDSAAAATPTDTTPTTPTTPTPVATTPAAPAPAPTALAGPLDPDDCTVAVTGDVDGDVVVGPGSVCVVGAVTVDGDIRAEAGATVIVEGARVEGDINAEGFAAVRVTGGVVDGAVQLFGGGTAVVLGVRVEGDIQAERNTAPLQISDNTVAGNLRCEGNDPAPTGGGNTVSGDKEGQCSGL